MPCIADRLPYDFQERSVFVGVDEVAGKKAKAGSVKHCNSRYEAEEHLLESANPLRIRKGSGADVKAGAIVQVSPSPFFRDSDL